MIVKTSNQSILDSNVKHIAFPINTSGLITNGLAKKVMEEYWPMLNFVGEHELGDVITKKVNDKTFYAMVCYDLTEGWNECQLVTLKKCLYNINTHGEILAIEEIGKNLTEAIEGADFNLLIVAMEDAKQSILLHTEMDLDCIKEKYRENKEKIRKK